MIRQEKNHFTRLKKKGILVFGRLQKVRYKKGRQ